MLPLRPGGTPSGALRGGLPALQAAGAAARRRVPALGGPGAGGRALLRGGSGRKAHRPRRAGRGGLGAGAVAGRAGDLWPVKALRSSQKRH